LRASNLQGFKIPGEVERLITTLFADDTTVYLSEKDKFEDLEKILRDWCQASGAKFNIQKTEIIPVGTEAYRKKVIETRKVSETHEEISNNIHIAREGEPVRILGYFAGNKIEQATIWTPTLEKIDAALARWARGNPTQNGRRLIIGMEVGGRTQYLTNVQGMPKDVEKVLQATIRDFMWGDSGNPTVNKETMSRKIEEG
ncbi:hypothetical protein BDN72DRAFT_750457, partial [Pluteus cervinus]